jgi:hypothetical protein
MPPLKSPVAEAIERHYRDAQTPQDDEWLRCSKLGEECERSLWYGFRWATPLQRHEGRVERLFQTGHREEIRMIDDLRAICCEVLDRDPSTGEQWRVKLAPWLRGSADGVVTGVPGAEKTAHLLECKTHNDKSFAAWKQKGVEASKPVHFAQMQLYMHGLSLTRALYMAHNKNDDTVECERVKYDPLAAQALLAKAERIALANSPPPKQESYACKWCRHEKTCRYDDFARVNCRTCLHSHLSVAGEWSCVLKCCDLSVADQHAGCTWHLYIPDLVPGEQIDADEARNEVTYSLRVHNGEGATYVDGKDPKPNVPEVEQ